MDPAGNLHKAIVRAAVLSLALAVSHRAAAADLVVMSSGGASVAQRNLAESSPAAPKVAFVVAMPAGLQAKLSAGEKADVIVAPEQALDALDRAGKLGPGTRVAVARVGVGLAVQRGAPKPDISTVAALRAALLSAPSIVHPDPAQAGSVAGKAIAKLLVELGIAETLKPKLRYRQAIAGGVEMVAKGEAAVGMFNISEILPSEGVALVGPLPREVQSYITFAASVVAGSPSADAARLYIASLTAPGARRHWEAAGLEPAGSAK